MYGSLPANWKSEVSEFAAQFFSQKSLPAVQIYLVAAGTAVIAAAGAIVAAAAGGGGI